MKTYAEILDDCEALVQDAGIDTCSPGANTVFATAEFDALMPSALTRISQFQPWQIKTTKTSSATTTRELTLTTGDKWRLLGILKAESPVDQDPRKFRGVSKPFDSVVTVETKNAPAASASIYFFWNKVHLLQSAVGTSTLVGALNANAAAGAVSVVLKSIGTGTVNECTTLMITGDDTVYHVIDDATIATTATVSIWPPLTAAALADAVVTLSLSTTLDMALEAYLARWLAAKAAISKSTKSYSQVNAAINTITNAATATGEIAALITKAITGDTADVVEGRKAAALGVTAVTAIAALINLAAGTADCAAASKGRAEIVLGDTAITTAAETQLALIDEEVALAIAALVSGNSLINTIPIGGGAAEYMGQASADLGTAQGRMMNGQAYLQKAAAYLNQAIGYYRAGGLELQAAGAKAQEAQANLANATGYFNAAGIQLRAASEKANEGITSLRLVATRLQVSQSGLRYEEWGRRELAQVEAELRAYGGYPSSVRYPRD